MIREQAIRDKVKKMLGEDQMLVDWILNAEEEELIDMLELLIQELKKYVKI